MIQRSLLLLIASIPACASDDASDDAGVADAAMGSDGDRPDGAPIPDAGQDARDADSPGTDAATFDASGACGPRVTVDQAAGELVVVDPACAAGSIWVPQICGYYTCSPVPYLRLEAELTDGSFERVEFIGCSCPNAPPAEIRPGESLTVRLFPDGSVDTSRRYRWIVGVRTTEPDCPDPFACFEGWTEVPSAPFSFP